jgi:hypothetical protein
MIRPVTVEFLSPQVDGEGPIRIIDGSTSLPVWGRVMAAVRCEQVGPGMRDSERCVSIRDVRGGREWVLVEQNFLAVCEDRTYLPVAIVQVDRERQLVLVEFPHQAATGGNRVWVQASDLIEANGARP